MTWGSTYVAGIFLVLILKPFVMGVLFDYHLYICLSQNPAVWHLESLHPGPSAGACTPHFSWVSRLPAAWRYAVWLGWFSAPSRGSLWTCAFSVFPWVFLLLSPKQTITWQLLGRAGTLHVLRLSVRSPNSHVPLGGHGDKKPVCIYPSTDPDFHKESQWIFAPKFPG